jgi:hypothetical protein
MVESSSGARSVLFKAVPGGWVFRSPNPWVFGDTPHYLVDDAQKAEIEAIILPRRPRLLAAAVIVGILGWAMAVATLMWAFSRHEDPTAGDIGLMVALIVLPMMALLPIAGFIQRRRLAPVLAGAPLTSERISYAEVRQNVRSSTPPKQLLNALVASVFACVAACFALLVHVLTRHVVFDAYIALWGFVAIAFGVASFSWYREVLRKASAPEGDVAAGQKVAWARWIGLGGAGLVCALALIYLTLGRSDAWGALAIGRAPAGGIVTVSVVGKASEGVARNMAIDACRNANSANEATRSACAVVATFRQKCFAFAGSEWAVAADEPSARQAAAAKCSGDRCRLVSGCSLTAQR